MSLRTAQLTRPWDLRCPHCRTRFYRYPASGPSVAIDPPQPYLYLDGETVPEWPENSFYSNDFDQSLLYGWCHRCYGYYATLALFFTSHPLGDAEALHCLVDHQYPDHSAVPGAESHLIRARLPKGLTGPSAWLATRFQLHGTDCEAHTVGPYPLPLDPRGPYGLSACPSLGDGRPHPPWLWENASALSAFVYRDCRPFTPVRAASVRERLRQAVAALLPVTGPQPPRPEPPPEQWPDLDDEPEPDEDPEQFEDDTEDSSESSLVLHQFPIGVPPQLRTLINFDADWPLDPGTRFASLCYRRPKPWWSDGRSSSTFAWPVWAALIHHPAIAIWLQDLAGSLGADDQEPTHRLVCDLADHKFYVLGADEAASLLQSQHPPVENDPVPVRWEDPAVQEAIIAVQEKLHERHLLQLRRGLLPGALRGLLPEEERLLLEMGSWLDLRLHELVRDGLVHPTWLQLLDRRMDS